MARDESSTATTASLCVGKAMGANHSIEVPSCTKCASPRGSSSKLDRLQSGGGTPTAEEDTGPTGSGRKQSTVERKALREFTDQRIAAMEAQKPKKSVVLERASTFMSVFGRGADDPEPEPEPEPEPIKRHCFARCCESKKAHVFGDQ